MNTVMAENTAAALATLQLKIGGMSCSFCANSIETALMREKGVEEVHVSLAHEEALIRFAPELTDEGRIKYTLTDLGFTIRDPRKVDAFEEQRNAIRHEARDLAMAATASIGTTLSMPSFTTVAVAGCSPKSLRTLSEAFARTRMETQPDSR